jgi:hypothetical protein
MLLMTLVFMFRNLALAVLISVGPVAWMLFPVRTLGPQWVTRYISALVALLLTGPLTIGFLTLIVNGLAGIETIWDPRAWPLLIGLVMIVFAPFAVFGMFSFVTSAAVDAVGSRIGGGAARTAGSAARGLSSIPTRVGAIPAGRTGPGRPSGSTPRSAPPTRVASTPATRTQQPTPTPSRSS